MYSQLRPRIISVVRQRGWMTRQLPRTSSSASGNKPKKNGQVVVAAVTITLAVGAGYCYVWSTQDEELGRRHEAYQSSDSHRHRLAAYMVSPTNRAILTERVNGLVDIPGLGERAEGIIIRKAVDQYMNALERIVVGDRNKIPASQADKTITKEDSVSLQAELAQVGDSQQGTESAKEDLVQRINAKCNIYGLSEAQEAVLIRGVVNQLFVLYPGIQKVL